MSPSPIPPPLRRSISSSSGPDAVTELVRRTDADVVLNALVGSLGLEPTLATLQSGARLALANKESLVAGGSLVTRAAAPGQIVPVDSEHSALAQCLRGGRAEEVDRLVLTASGGPFRGWTTEMLESVNPAEAKAHPTWSMGPMNTLNSASLVNKGLELIETHLLFGVPYDRIDVTVHPQSIVHSMVTFVDGSTLAQASPPDMKLPIALALGWPDRIPGAAAACDFSTASTWTFEPVDDEVFPAVDLARQAGEAGGSVTAVYNAANEVAAQAFLDGKITFPAIVRTVARAVEAADVARRTRYRGRRPRGRPLGTGVRGSDHRRENDALTRTNQRDHHVSAASDPKGETERRRRSIAPRIRVTRPKTAAPAARKTGVTWFSRSGSYCSPSASRFRSHCTSAGTCGPRRPPA